MFNAIVDITKLTGEIQYNRGGSLWEPPPFLFYLIEFFIN